MEQKRLLACIPYAGKAVKYLSVYEIRNSEINKNIPCIKGDHMHIQQHRII
jgi:hypothetical protein